MQNLDDATKEILERALGLVVTLTGSRVAALFTCDADNEAPLLQVSHRVDQEALDQVKSAWFYGRDTLAMGNRLDCPGGGLVEPVLAGRNLRALIYLDAPGTTSADEVTLVKALVAKRLAENETESAPVVTVDAREQLLLLLERNEWNIARVARLLGVSRLTVYRRLAKLGLARPEETSEAVAGALPETGTA